MKFEDHWNATCVQNPLLLSQTDLRVKVINIKALMKSAYEAGLIEARSESSIFDQIFGKGKQ